VSVSRVQFELSRLITTFINKEHKDRNELPAVAEMFYLTTLYRLTNNVFL
jgi:hypothetical protein